MLHSEAPGPPARGAPMSEDAEQVFGRETDIYIIHIYNIQYSIYNSIMAYDISDMYKCKYYLDLHNYID